MTTAAPYTKTEDKTKFVDSTAEWSGLAALLETENTEFINRMSPALFTGERITTFYGMQKAFIEDGSITFEGLNAALEGNVPGELFSARGAKIRPIVKELARLARKRQAARKAAQFKKLSEEFDPSLDELQEASMFDPILADEDSSVAAGSQALLSDLHAKRSGNYRYAKTGLTFLDSAMGGEWKPKSVVIYAGGPGTGKTTLAAQSMLTMAQGYVIAQSGEKVETPSLFLSLEMAKEDLLVKWLGNTLEINTTDIQSGQLSEEDYDRIEHQTIYLNNLPMYVIDNSTLTLGQMIYEIRKHIYNKGVRVVFIDYLQIVNHHPTGNDNSDLGEFAIAMKALAKRENITIVILSQITPGKDGVFKIRDSGEVGAVADVVIQSLLDSDEPGAIKSVQVDKMKNRFGPTGATSVAFNGPYQRFEEATYV